MGFMDWIKQRVENHHMNVIYGNVYRSFANTETIMSNDWFDKLHDVIKRYAEGSIHIITARKKLMFYAKWAGESYPTMIKLTNDVNLKDIKETGEYKKDPDFYPRFLKHRDFFKESTVVVKDMRKIFLNMLAKKNKRHSGLIEQEKV